MMKSMNFLLLPFLISACAKTDLKDPVGEIRRLVSRYNPSVLPQRIIQAVPTVAQAPAGEGTEQGGTGIAAGLSFGISQPSNSTALYELRLGMDQIAERTQELSLTTLMIDKAWQGINYYCKRFNSGADGTALSSLTTLTLPTGTRTDSWINCKVAEGQVNVEIDQDLIAAIQEAMGGDDISSTDKAELQRLDGKSIDLQDLEITRYGGSTPTDQSSGVDNGYAFRIVFNADDSANRKIIRWNAARTKTDITDYETHTDDDGEEFESKAHFYTINESNTSGKQYTELFMFIRQGDDLLTEKISMQQRDGFENSNGLLVSVMLQQTGRNANFLSLVDGVIDDNGGFARARYTPMDGSTGYTPASDGIFGMTVTGVTCDASLNWDDLYGVVVRSGGSNTYDGYWGTATTGATYRFCALTVDDDGNITGASLASDTSVTPALTPGSTTVYNELFDASGNLTAYTSNGSLTSAMTGSAYYTAYNAALDNPDVGATSGSGELEISDAYQITGLTGGLTNPDKADLALFPNDVVTNCGDASLSTTWFEKLMGFGKYQGTGAANSLASYAGAVWGPTNRSGDTVGMGNIICRIEYGATGLNFVSAGTALTYTVP